MLPLALRSAGASPIFILSTRGKRPRESHKGLIIMTTYNTTDLAIAIMGEDAIEANRKGATRTLRKFLRTDFAAKEMQTPGKGGRYSIDLNKRDLTSMAKRFSAWQLQQEEEANARREAKGNAIIDEAPIKGAEGDDEAVIEFDADASDEVDGPSDEEIAGMLEEINDES